MTIGFLAVVRRKGYISGTRRRVGRLRTVCEATGRDTIERLLNRFRLHTRLCVRVRNRPLRIQKY